MVMTDDIFEKCCCENRLDPIGMVRSKAELMLELKNCKCDECVGCLYESVGCSSSMAHDALLVIEDLERQIESGDKYIQYLEEREIGMKDYEIIPLLRKLVCSIGYHWYSPVAAETKYIRNEGKCWVYEIEMQCVYCGKLNKAIISIPKPIKEERDG